MSTTTLGNGSVRFGDGTQLSSSQLTLANISGAPTNLSQFTNDLGNYNNWLTSSNINQTYSGYYSASEYGPRYLYWNGSTLSIVATNCNCNCNC